MPLVVVTVSEGTLSGLEERLSGSGRRVEIRPLVRFEDADPEAVRAALRELPRYGAVAFTSPRAAAIVARHLESASGPGLSPGAVWASGGATARAAGEQLGPIRVPDPAEAGKHGAGLALARAMLDAGVGSPVLFPCAAGRREELPAALRSAGIEVVELICYRSVPADERVARDALRNADVAVIGSPSAARLISRACADRSRPALVALGPSTGRTAADEGWETVEVATRPTEARVAAAVDVVLGHMGY